MRLSITMHPFLLHFSEDTLERLYAEWRSKSTFVSMDWKFAILNVAMFGWFAIKEMLSDASPLGLQLIVVSLVGYLLQLLAMRLVDEWWLRHRMIVVLLLRVMRLGIAIVGVPLWIRHRESEGVPLFRSLSLGSGSMLNLWIAFGMPMLFRYHLMIQIPSALLMLTVTGWKRCQEFVQIKDAAHNISQISHFVSHQSSMTGGLALTTCKRIMDMNFRFQNESFLLLIICS